MRRVLPLIAVLLIGLAPAPFPKADATKEDLKKMQGAWVSQKTQGIEWVITGDRVTIIENGAISSVRSLTLDATTRPRSIDVRAESEGIKHALGRYRVTHDTLTVSFGLRRPCNLSERDQSSFGVWVFKRKKP